MQNTETAKIQSEKVQEPITSVPLVSGISQSLASNVSGDQCLDPTTSATFIPTVSSFTALPFSSERILEDQLSLFRNSGKLKY